MISRHVLQKGSMTCRITAPSLLLCYVLVTGSWCWINPIHRFRSTSWKDEQTESKQFGAPVPDEQTCLRLIPFWSRLLVWRSIGRSLAPPTHCLHTFSNTPGHCSSPSLLFAFIEGSIEQQLVCREFPDTNQATSSMIKMRHRKQPDPAIPLVPLLYTAAMRMGGRGRQWSSHSTGLSWSEGAAGPKEVDSMHAIQKKGTCEGNPPKGHSVHFLRKVGMARVESVTWEHRHQRTHGGDC